MGIIDRIKGVLGDSSSGDGSAADRLVREIIAIGDVWWDIELKDTEVGKELLEQSREEQRKVAVALIKRVRGFKRTGRIIHKDKKFQKWRAAVAALNALLRRNLPFSDGDLRELVGWQNEGQFVMPRTATALAHFTKTQEPSKALVREAEKLSAAMSKVSSDAGMRKYGQRVAAAIGLKPAIMLKEGDVWADQAIADLAELPEEQLAAWNELLAHCQTASAARPSGKWLKPVEKLIPDLIPAEQFRDFMAVWFPLLDKPALRDPNPKSRSRWNIWVPMQLIESNQDVLKGLVWCCSLQHDPDIIRLLGPLCISAFKKIPGRGPRATRLGNACIFALGALEGPDALAQLALLKVKIKNRGTQNQITKALQVAADREGVTPDEIEEMSVPEYGLTGIGVFEELMGDFTARLTIAGTSSTELVWVKPDGKIQKSVPAAVKADFADELKELRANAKDIQKMLPVIRERIDGAYLRQKSWPFATWKERYLDHPLVGSLARRLIWSFGRDEDLRTGIFQEDGEFVDALGNPVDSPADDDEETPVRLWHPLDSATEDVLAWRNWLEEHLVQQPFKQAHREIYLLTEAEENTGTYSNRYAAHILKQHQFNALCLARSWRNSLRLMVDDEYPPATKYLPEWGLRAEYWVEGLGDNYRTDVNDAGTYLYLITDQVRFYPVDAAQMTGHASGGGYGAGWRGGSDNPLSLSEVPQRVFSEIMRDVDLFVGIASVGNDPNWSDGGPEGNHRDYWYAYSFGDLSATAQTRKAILERLLPRLKIAGQTRIDGKFLVVEGKIRTYKIHLGSGNILMAPDDQYLCIVPNAADRRRGTNKLFLPFEGDNIMAIVLSKAFLLAADDRIKDRTILSQIRPKG